ncbi:centromere protein F [Osmerus eperlanus]|uniref:centromere protein F n=1 Tax=Osmerus eperlanus TaxID=29151 RepID=UPI002E0F6FF7
MSWAEEDWTVGLSGLALRKVKEMQVQQERLQREKQQKQLQLDSSQTALHKQTAKHEEVRGELLRVQRDLQVALEEAQAGAGTRERLLQELQVKQAQVCSLEGQLDSSRAHAHTLAQEVKRLEAELEKLQNSSSSGDSILFSTPCWNMNSPWDHNEGKHEDRHGHRAEGDSKALHVRQQLQFSDSPKPLPSFPRHLPKSTPHRHPSHQLDSSAVSSVFPWERGDPQAAERGRPTAPSSPAAPSADVIRRGQDSGDYGKEEEMGKRCVSELQSRVCVLEGELCAEAERLRQTQDQLTQTRRELGSREHSLQKARDELSLAHTRISQESDRVSSAEQRQKQLQEELKCQRQNTETSRVHAQQRTRDLEKQHQRDVLELQKERQSLEKQHQQEVNKLNQEIQQARTLHNALQAQFEKLSLQKQAAESEAEGLKEKLRWTEGELKESKKVEAQTQAKLTEAQREAEGLSVTLEQSRRKEKGLEEEVKRLTQDLADALRILKELQDQQTASVVPVTPVHFSPSGQSFAPLPSPHHARLSSHTLKKLAREERGREGEEDRGDRENAGWKASYPSEREPGEGIDAEHISSFSSAGVEEPRRAGERAGQEERQRGEPSPETLVEDALRREASTKAQDAPHRVHTAHPDPESPSRSRSDGHPSSDDLRRENAALLSELRDVKEELAKRLEDLDGQRRAEAETRTRLKQLSRKHAAQAEHGREREEQDRERKRELEEERAEKERLKQAVVALEAKAKRGREEMVRRERDQERERDHEDRESERIELNIQLKKQLAEVKTLLALEREEREREREAERKRMKKKGMEGAGDLTLKLTELEAELEELKNRGSVEGKNSNERNSPLTYLTLQSDINSNSNIITDTKFLPSPDQHRLFCESSNQQNMAVSLATAAADLIQEEAHLTKLPELSIPTIVAQTTLVAKKGVSTSNLEETTCEALRGESFDQPDLAETALEPQVESNTDLKETTKDPWGGGCAWELAQEVERLRGENAREAGQALQTQAKLEALQTQVTCQTRQLTLAFDKQSQHIVDLLAELQLKEGALFSQGGELQRCREELASLTAPRQKEQGEKDVKKREEEGERNTETPEEEKEKEEEEAAEGKEGGEAENQKHNMKLEENIIHLHLLTATQEPSVSKGDVCLTRTEDPQRQDGGEEAFAKELQTLKQENHQLKMRLQSLEASDRETRSSVSEITPPDTIEDPDRTPVEERAGNYLTSSPMELKGEQLIEGVSDITPSLKSALQDEDKPKDEMREDRKIQEEGEEEGEAVSEEESHSDRMTQPQINCLQQQVVALQAHLQILSEEHQKQADELVLWRLTTNELTQVQMPWLTQDQTLEQATCLGQEGQPVPGGSPSSVTVIREDELLLSCTSSRLYGRTLGSRIQHCTSPEPNPLQYSPRQSSSGPQEHMSPEEDEDEANRTTVVPKEAHSSSGHQVKALGLADTDESRPRGQTQTKEVEPRENASHPASDMEAHSTQSLSLENQTAPDQCNTKQRETISVSDLVVDFNHLSSSHCKRPQTTTTMVSTLESQTTVEQVQLEGQRSELSELIPPQISTSVFPSGMSDEKYPAEGEGGQGSKFTKAAKHSDALEKVSQMEVRSTATQTEEGSATTPTPHELHQASTQTEEEEDEEELVDSPPLSPIPPAEGCDRLLFSGSFPIPSDPARLAERIRRSRSQMSAAYDDTEYEPYGLPEVVMKGFADIPSGPACPYIVRRGLLGTPAVPLPPKEPGPKEGGRGRPKQP